MSRSITGAVHALYAGTQRVMRGEFSQLIQVVGARSAGRVQRLVQHHDAESGAADGGVEREGTPSRPRSRSRGRAGPAVSQGAAGVREPAVFWECHPRAWSGRLLRLPAGGWKARDRDRRRCREGNFGGAVDGHHTGGRANGTAGLAGTAACWTASVSQPRGSFRSRISNCTRTRSPEKYATFFSGPFRSGDGLLTYTNAGHLQPVLFRDRASPLLWMSTAPWLARFPSRHTRRAS